MYAIVKIAGRQYKVVPNANLKVDRLSDEVGSEVTVNDVIMFADGDNTEIGTPILPYNVKFEVVEHGRRPKVIYYHFKRRGGMRKKIGSRRQFTVVKIKSIEKGE